MHFREEECIQQLQHFPGYEGHKKEHASFVARFKVLKQEIDREVAELHHVIETNHLLLTWLIHHISTSDVHLVSF